MAPPPPSAVVFTPPYFNGPPSSDSPPYSADHISGCGGVMPQRSYASWEGDRCASSVSDIAIDHHCHVRRICCGRPRIDNLITEKFVRRIRRS